MNTRIVGIVLLVVGVILLVMGMTATTSFENRWSRFFTGHFTDTTSLYILGGAAAGVTGLVLSMKGSGGRTA